MLYAGNTNSPGPGPGTSRVWTGTFANQGASSYLPDLTSGIRSSGGRIDAAMTGPANADFRFLLISVDSGNSKRLVFNGPAGRYALYVEAQRGSGAYQIEARIP